MRSASDISSAAIKNNRKLKVFLFFLILTAVIWLLVELSKTYTSTIAIRVSFTNVPSNKMLQEDPVSELNATVRGPGFNLLKLKIKKPKVELDLNNLVISGNSHYLLTNRLISNLSAQIVGETNILNIEKDTLFFDFGTKIFKRVPVMADLNVQFNLGHNLTNGLKITPDSVLISGPEKFVDSIVEIRTNYLEINEVSQHIDTELPLNIGNIGDFVTLSDEKVKIYGEVDKFTEGSFSLPVVIINEPEGVKINPFPKEIEIIYQAGLSNFSKITKNSFTIVYDFKQYESDSLIKYLTPMIQQKSEFVSSFKINPGEIEFLIQK